MARKPYVRVTPEILDEAFEAIAAGMTLSEFCRQPGRPTRVSICRVIAAGGPEIAERFQEARRQGYDVLAEQVLEIVDEPPPLGKFGTDGAAVQHQKLRADARLRLLAKWDTARYGDRVQVAGDPDAPLRLSDGELREEIMSLLATAAKRRLSQPRIEAGENGHDAE